MSTPHAFVLSVPALLEAPIDMHSAVAEVLAGEYEAGFDGEGLQILDLGANVGAFSLWAAHRWPNSTIDAYEPHPGTFALLTRNLATYLNVRAHNVAVYPSRNSKLPFYARHVGDGEAGLTECMARTFAELESENIQLVDILHPAQLPRTDIVKLDVEGAEAAILSGMALDGISLVLLEYQDDANRAGVKALLSEKFVLEREDEFSWDDLLHGSDYRRDLSGNHYGHLVFAARSGCRLRRSPAV